MDVSSIALSGLNAASTRLSVSANNIANADTPGSHAKDVKQTTNANGGVDVSVVDRSPPTVTASDGQGGTQQLPNTSPDAELVNTQTATYNFQANLRMIKTEDDLQQSVLNITA